jgi:hypothetical protein
MRICNRPAHLEVDLKELAPVGRRVRAVGQAGCECPAFDQLHHKIGPTVRESAEAVHRDDARVLELPAHLGLFDEPLFGGSAAGQFGLEHLNRQVPAEVWVAALENYSHPAAGNLAKELERVAPASWHVRGRGLDERGVVRRLVAQERRLRPPAGSSFPTKGRGQPRL